MEFKVLPNLAEAKKFYDTYVKSDLDGLIVRRCGQNQGDPGKPNAVFHISSWSVPLTQETQLRYDVTKGFLAPNLIKSFHNDFSDEARICFGTQLYHDSHRSGEIHFHTTLNPLAVKYVLIANKHSAAQSQAALADVQRTAYHYRQGFTEEDEYPCWDYYYLPIDYAGDKRDPDLVKERRQAIRALLEKLFGDLSCDMPMDVLPETRPEDSEPELSLRVDPVTAEHYEDGMQHIQTWVIDEHGRMLAPNKSSLNKADSFIDATVACEETWNVVPQTYLVVKYHRECFTDVPVYTVEREPAVVSNAQMDRLLILEKKLEEMRAKQALSQEGLPVTDEDKSKTWSARISKRSD